jgi:hypothetical protein
MKKRQALTRALVSVIMVDFIKNPRPPSLKITDNVKLSIAGIFLLVVFTFWGYYFALNKNDIRIMFWGILIGFFFATWFAHASEIIKERYQFLNKLRQIEKNMEN